MWIMNKVQFRKTSLTFKFAYDIIKINHLINEVFIISVIKRTATSKQMKNNYNMVKNMSGGMKFNEDMVNINWKRVRWISDIGYTFMPKEKGVKFQRINLNGVNAIISIPKDTISHGIVLYIHGGGMVSGSAKGTKGYCSMLANKIGCRVISIDYSLAPEHPFPDGLNDCFTAYTEIKRLYPDAKIALIGESGGANLCFALIIRCINNDVEIPSCVVAHSGIFDMSGSLERNYDEINDITVTKGAYAAMQKMYAPDMDIKNPEISPLFFEDFSRFPPTVFTCDSKETLKVESYRMYENYIDAGIEATLYEYESTFHAFGPIGTMAPETTELLEENGEFIRKYIN